MRRRAILVVAEVRVEGRKIEQIDHMMQRVGKTAGHQLVLQHHRQKPWTHVDQLGSRHRFAPCSLQAQEARSGPVFLQLRQASLVHIMNLQAKARPLLGRIEHYWFENEHIGLKKTRFHRIEIPFEPFDSGLSYVSQPEATSLVVEWLVLDIEDPGRLTGVEVTSESAPEMEASIYLGSAHNGFRIDNLSISPEGTDFLVTCHGMVEFENEGVARNESFSLQARATYAGEA
ncbi:MAG: hypothetical protein ACT4NL_15185 [Pseudomarimonas sp.]